MTEKRAKRLPYVHLLEGRDPLEVLSETPARLSDLFHGLGSKQIEFKPAPGKWNVREVQIHLADCEIAWSWRLRQIFAEPNPTLQPFDQDAWSQSYDNYPFTQARNTWSILRAWNLTFLSTLSLSDRTRPAVHPEYGPVMLWTVAGIAAGHDLHHLASLNKMLLSPAWGPHGQDGTTP
jgi:hypothetical protein